MIWTILSVLVCLALAIKLIFFTEKERLQSRPIYRVTLFLSAVYAFKQVVDFLYGPLAPTSPWVVMFHLALFVGAVFLKAHHLPWNHSHDTGTKATDQGCVRCLLARGRVLFRSFCARLCGRARGNESGPRNRGAGKQATGTVRAGSERAR